MWNQQETLGVRNNMLGLPNVSQSSEPLQVLRDKNQFYVLTQPGILVGDIDALTTRLLREGKPLVAEQILSVNAGPKTAHDTDTRIVH